MQPNLEDAPRALAGSGNGGTGIIGYSCRMNQSIDYVKLWFVRISLHMIESSEKTKFTRRRSLLIDRFISVRGRARHA